MVFRNGQFVPGAPTGNSFSIVPLDVLNFHRQIFRVRQNKPVSTPRSPCYLLATTSATTTDRLLVLALRSVLRRVTWLNPAARNSSRKLPASFAPATQENQLPSVSWSGGSASHNTSSAA